MRWELIDRFELLKKGHSAIAHKSFSGAEDFFRENYPGKPVVPEAFFVEMVAQTGGVLFGLSFNFDKEVILAKILKAVFHQSVPSPCDFVIQASVDEEKEEGAWISGQVYLADKIVAEVQLLLVTMDAGSMGQNKKIVFNDGFLKHYDVFNVAKKSEALL